MRTQIEKFGLLSSGVLLGVLISLNISAWAEKNISNKLPIEDLRVFAEVFGRIKADYVEPVEDKQLIDEALTGMLQGLDPHSAYLDKDAYKDMQAGTQGEFGGLGIEVTMEDGLVKVVAPIEDSPAYKIGLKAGDLVMKLDDKQVRGLTLGEAVKLMRGKKGTDITLTVLRKNATKPLEFTITRDIIKTKSVKTKAIEQDYGYVRISQFQEHTGADLARALAKISQDNKKPLKGFILDLRNNPGGLLDAAVGVSAAFLPRNDLVVYTEGRVADSKMRLSARPSDYARRSRIDYLKIVPEEYKEVPMVVMVNAGSASASEIVAGALQDHERATILGVKSFGKGSVQTILPMNNGSAIKLTTARYFTPKGRSIQAKGIVPDQIVEDGSDQSFRLHEADLKGRLSNPAEGKDDKESNKKPNSAEKEKALDQAKKEFKKPKYATPKGRIEPASKDDFQFVQAMNLLKGLPVKKAPPVIETVADKTDDKKANKK